MAKSTKGSFQMICLLMDMAIESDLCVEIQECIEGNIPVTLELEEFVEVENCQEICMGCKHHIIVAAVLYEKILVKYIEQITVNGAKR